MKTNESVILKRDCGAIQIPSGNIITLFQGTHLTITQALGGTYTVVTDQGLMASVAGKDAEALGKEAQKVEMPSADNVTDEAIEKGVWAQLRTCFDPEIPHNIVDLGLIYQCLITPLESGGKKVEIKMTLTAPGCGMGEWLKADVRNKVETVPGIKVCQVEVVFDPPWNPSLMSPPLRRALNMM